MQSASSHGRMTREEIRASLSLGSIFALRMLGLFLILPVFALHAPELAGGSNLTLVGLAMGAYGLTQAFLHLPYGIAADRLGRKRVIVFGLVLFAAGSFIAAASTDIWITILGRAIQGAGAISAAVMALAADLTREEHRTKTMAVIGASIGLVFALSLVTGPFLYRWVGLGGIFALTGILSLAGIWVVAQVVPPEPPAGSRAGTGLSESMLRPVLRDGELVRLYVGTFILSMVQMSMFVVFPKALASTGGIPVDDHWKVYLPVVVGSFVLMLPAIVSAERGRMRAVFVGAVLLLVAVQVWLAGWASSLWTLSAALLGYFVGFNILEATLPSLVSRVAAPAAKGTALGVYNTTLSFGLFAGGALGGWIAQRWGAPALYAVNAALLVGWALLAWTMREPAPLAKRTVPVPAGADAASLKRALLAVTGVRDAIVVPEEGVAYLKVAPGWDEGTVMKLVEGRA